MLATAGDRAFRMGEPAGWASYDPTRSGAPSRA
jgi:hypothetical protein